MIKLSYIICFLIFFIKFHDANKYLIELYDSNFNETLYHYDLALVKFAIPGKFHFI
jgi:hypothetical protein